MTDEFGFIERLKKISDINFSRNLNDDVCNINGDYIISTDTYVENKHFFENMCPKKIIYKTFYSAISDIYAKASSPKYLIFNVTLTNNCNDEWINAFIDGLIEMCEKHNVKIIGGDTTNSNSDIVVTYTFFGSPSTILSNNFSHGDYVYLTGNLGGSSIALESILNNLNLDIEKYYYEHENYLDIPWVYRDYIKSSFDISDGFYQDFSKKISNTDLGIYINVEDIPINENIIKYCDFIDGFYDIILNGGDDYCCLFNSEMKFNNTKNLHCIGRLDKNIQSINFKLNGKKIHVKKHGYKSF